MFSEELESIIEAALADGVLTAKEREVLHRRAAAEGVDLDELDVVIDGRLAKMKREVDWLRPVPPAPPVSQYPPVPSVSQFPPVPPVSQYPPVPSKKDNKYGDVKKCPQCGNPVEPMAVRCSSCGYEFRNVEALKSSQKLAEKLEEISKAYRGKKGNDFYRQYDEQAQVIMHFPVPTTKEDLLDFVISMRANWNNPDSFTLQSAYKAKYEECLNKVKILFANDPQFQIVFEQAEKDNTIGAKLKRFFS